MGMKEERKGGGVKEVEGCLGEERGTAMKRSDH